MTTSAKQEQRRKLIDRNLSILADHGVPTKKLSDIHYRIFTTKGAIDVWPTRGSWMPLWTRKKGKSIPKLLNFIENNTGGVK